ncbi:DNA transposition protein [Thalassospira marina]|uniref:DNA transposition protein n=1 Tax=Thalassospira marina TaxID=2048283 RepID=A0A2N3KYG0_9PROT|nr:DNA transposition protein [Thalassospira marina]PKR55506.1 DNA transposition protein [Thalassospira marina]
MTLLPFFHAFVKLRDRHMAKQNSDTGTIDLLNEWTPPKVAVTFETPERVRAISFGQRISRAVSEVLRESGKSREEIAAAMSEFLGEEVSKNMLDAYASMARESHTISLERAFALLHATRDARIFGMELGRFDYAVIPERYLGAVEDAMIEDQKEQLKRAQLAARKKWKGGGR